MRTTTAIAALTGTLMIPVVGFFNIPAAHADSLSAKESAYVIAYGAGSICPSNWNLLVETGKAFRDAKGGQLV